MRVTQTIEVTAVDEQAIHDLVAAWHAEQHGIAPGYVGGSVIADEAAPGRYMILVDFASAEEAARNNDRPETAGWATKLGELTTSPPRFRNFRSVCSTYGDR